MMIIKYGIVIFIVLYAVFLLLIYLWQEKLIFQPPMPNLFLHKKWKNNEIIIKSGIDKLQCWKIVNDRCDNKKTIIYFGGNAEDVVSNLADAAFYSAREIYFVNLSGYGKSTGRPSQDAFYKNGVDVYDFIVNKQMIDPETIILLGRSLGSAVAIYVNSKKIVSALILVTPFDALKNVLPGILKFVLPIFLLLKHEFNNIRYIPKIKNNILILSAAHDEVIPARSTLKLYSACDNNAKFKTIERTSHNNIKNEMYFMILNDFLNR